MKIDALLSKLKGKDIRISLNDGNLKIKAPEGSLSPDLIDELKKNKPELLEFLSGIDNPGLQVDLVRAEDKEYYSLTSSQKRLFMLQSFDPESTAYNMPNMIPLEGELESSRIENVICQLIERHDCLRTSFHFVNEVPVQKVHPKMDFDLNILSCSENEFEILASDFIRPFDLETPSLIRAAHVITDKGQRLFLDVHHIISDGISQQLLIKEFMLLYKGVELPALNYRFIDYVEWMEQDDVRSKLEIQSEYWKNIFSSELTPLNLPYDYPRPSVQSSEGKQVTFALTDIEFSKIQAISSAHEMTTYMTLTALISMWLSKLGGTTDIVLGSPVFGRDQAETQNMFGLFINTLAIRNSPDGQKSVKDFFAEVRSNLLSAFKNQDFPFEDLVEQVLDTRVPGRNPLFDVLFSLQEHTVPMTSIETERHVTASAKVDLTFEVNQFIDGLQFTVSYVDKLFKPNTIERFFGYLKTILNAISIEGNQMIGSIGLLTKDEQNIQFQELNDTHSKYPLEKTIVQLFEEQVIENSEKSAIEFRDLSLTYAELNQSINQFTHFLKDKYSIQLEELVTIQLERNEWFTIAMLAVLKCGGAYVPIDPSYPKERIEYIEEDSNSKFTITGDVINDFLGTRDSFSTENPEQFTNAKNLAYVIYTSGSTGKPKGVLVENQAIVRLVKNTNYYDSQDSRTLGLSSYAFDAATFELFISLLNGGTMIIAEKELMLDPKSLGEQIKQKNIDGLFITTALFNTIVDENLEAFSSIKQLLVGGEQASVKHFERFNKQFPNIRIQNVYGPTENTTFSLGYEVTSEAWTLERIPIGFPISNSTCYVVDEFGNLQPDGVVGELWVGGDGIARGYLNRENLTQEKFSVNPFDSGRIYRTGDLCVHSAKGGIVFIGRKDNQVKIRGHRIELGEIEHQLRSISIVEKAVILVKENETGVKFLIGFVSSEKKEFNSSDVLNELRTSLPEYMIPQALVHLSEFPVTSNGKTDKKALLKMSASSGSKNKITPVNEIESQLLEWWTELLDVKDISVDDNFFALGGHSLMITKLLSRIHQTFDVRISVAEVYQAASIQTMALLIAGTGETAYKAIPKAEKKEFYSLSPSQRRLFMVNQFDPENLAYNMPMPIRLSGTVEHGRVQQVIQTLIDRHESLRTSFKMEEGTPVQVIGEELTFSLEQISGAEDQLKEIEREFIRPFDLKQAPLIRGVFIQLKDEALLLLDMHHIVNDGVSQNVLEREFERLYSGETLNEVGLQYRDYSEWLNSAEQQSVLESQEDYWLSQFSDEVPVLQLPCDFERPELQSFEGASILVQFTPNERQIINDLCKKYDLTTYMVFIGMVNLWLSKLSGEEDVVIGSPIAGRTHVDLEEIVGVFINTIALRNYPEGQKSIDAFFTEVKENTLQAYANQEYPFETLVQKTLSHRDTSRSPLFDVLLVVQNQFDSVQSSDSTSLSEHKEELTKFDLSLEVYESEEHLHLSLGYATKLFLPETMNRFLGYFRKMIAELGQNPVLIDDIDVVSEEEKEVLLRTFNNTEHDFPEDKTLVDFFYDRVEEMPDSVALVFKDKSFSYRQLDEYSNQLASFLTDRFQISKGDLISIKLERGEWMMISILAVIKMGAAYVPIAPDYPEARVKYMEENSQCKLSISAELIESFNNEKETHSSKRPEVTVNPLDRAYVIYTSGSTGNPKGCELNHRGIVNRIEWMWDALGFKKGETVLQKTTFTFDVSVWEIFLPLCWGNKMVICTTDDIVSPEKLIDLIRIHQVNTMHFVPSMFKAFISELKDSEIKNISSLERIITSGEALALADVKDWYGLTPIPIHNLYGPTEASIDVSFFNTSKEDREIPIGKPIWNTQLYVLNDQLDLVPTGVPGEICIGGVGLSTGYLNNPELTSEKFTDNPFAPGEKLYRTGDIGKWTSDGQLLYLNRKDDQVKIRGYRIELGEIENALRSISNIEEAAVIAKSSSKGEKTLVAFIVLSEEMKISEIKSELLGELPEFMIPGMFYRVPEMPLTPNGKLDRRALSSMGKNLLMKDSSLVNAESDLELALVEVWKEVLEHENIGVSDSFFELGGDSIKVLRVSGMIKSRLGWEINLQDLYRNDTIAKISTFIKENETNLIQHSEATEELKDEVLNEIEQIKQTVLDDPRLTNKENIEDIFPMSAIEKGMVFESVLDQSEGVYHDQAYYQREFENFDFDRFKKAFGLLVEKHAILRSSYNLADFKHEVHLVHKAIELPVNYVDVSWLSSDERHEKIATHMKDGLNNPFDTTIAPLWKMTVFQLRENGLGFAWQFHHAILDGWSNASLITELNNIYRDLETSENYEPQKLKSNYKDFIIESLMGRKNEGLKEFWKQEMEGYSRLDLFTEEDENIDYSKGLTNDQLTSLEKTSSEIGVSVKTFAFGAYLELLNVLNVENEIVTGLVTNTRPATEDSDKILGCFLNTIPFRIEMNGQESIQNYVLRIHEKLNSLKGKERLELLEISRLANEKPATGSPFFDVLFNYIDFHIYNSINDGNSDQNVSNQENEDRFLDWEKTNTFLDFSVNKTGGQFNVSLTLNRVLKSNFSAEQIVDLYFTILDFMVENLKGKLSEIDLLQEGDKKHLAQFNDTKNERVGKQTIVGQISDQVNLTPNLTAVISGNQKLTYIELEEESNRFSHFLKEEYAVKPGDLIAIKMESSDSVIAAILGIMKTRAAYLPMDIKYPEDRVQYMLEDSKSSLLIDSEIMEKFSASKKTFTHESLKEEISPDDLAYVIYTSGSTGKPKGVMVSHKAVADYMQTVKDYFVLTPDDRVMQQASLAFDVSVEEIFPTLSSGACLLITGNNVSNTEELIELISEKKVTVLSTTPVVINELNNKSDYLSSIRVLISGGDELKAAHYSEIIAEGIDLYNTYGPTETTVCATYHKVSGTNDSNIIGAPISNHQIHIINDDLQLLPIGVVGEIAIAGNGMSNGYLNQPDITAEKFISSPFDDKTLYLSGDLGRWNSDGNIEFFGRKDDQVKIRGYRIEIGEVESAIYALNEIDVVAVICDTDKDNNKYLAAFVSGGDDLNSGLIREKLLKSLPEYMIPAQFVQLDVLPVTSNGKVDRKQLIVPNGMTMKTGNDYIAPNGELESTIVEVWSIVLELDQKDISVLDNFFEIGGDSIRILKVLHLLKEKLEQDISVALLFQYPSIEKLAAHMEKQEESNAETEELIEESKEVLFDSMKLFIDDDE